MGAFGIILILMFMAIMVDMGLYFISYKKLSSAASYAEEEVKQMLPYYSYSPDYRADFETEFYNNLTECGYTASNVTKDVITRTYAYDMGHPVISVELNIVLHDKYECIFLGMIGIQELNISVKKITRSNYGVDQFYYPGMPCEEWDGGVELVE